MFYQEICGDYVYLVVYIVSVLEFVYVGVNDWVFGLVFLLLLKIFCIVLLGIGIECWFLVCCWKIWKVIDEMMGKFVLGDFGQEFVVIICCNGIVLYQMFSCMLYLLW